MKARGVVRISPDDVGNRVTVRYRIAREGGGPGMTDVVGTLEWWRDGSLAVRRRDGSLVQVAEQLLVAARTISAKVPHVENERE